MIKYFLTVATILALAGGLIACNNDAPGRSGKTTSVGTADIGGAFSLIDDAGVAVTEAELLGKPNLVYFGFTYCPDVCPTALQKMGAAQELLGMQGDKIGYVLISVDPERDTPESLSQYVSANGFPEGLRGFTGPVEKIEEAKSAYKVFAQKVDTPESAGDYTVDHSDIIYFMNAEGEFVDYFYSKSTPQDIAVRVRLHLKSGK